MAKILEHDFPLPDELAAIKRFQKLKKNRISTRGLLLSKLGR